MKWHGREILPLRHRYNCQINDAVYPPPFGVVGKFLLALHHARHHVPTSGFRSSERAIEIPLALDFIANTVGEDPLVELGCVLPYYILKRENHVVYDLVDNHPQCIRRDIREMGTNEFKANIVSVSTLEHIDRDEYGIASTGNVSGVDILKRIIENSKRCFVTFPLGCNKVLDDFVLSADDLCEEYVTRVQGNPNDWQVVEKKNLTQEMVCYGTYLNANTVCVVSK